MVDTEKPLTLESLRARRAEILRIAAEYGARNVRVFGSVARGEADQRSDVDLLVDIPGDVGGFDYFGRLDDLRRALSDVIGRDVDLVDSAGLRRLRARILGEAIAL
jgi:predicted nucleotidyltransferase